MAQRRTKGRDNGRTETYQHPDADLAMRPEVGTQPQFRKKKPPVTYRYDSSAVAVARMGRQESGARARGMAAG